MKSKAVQEGVDDIASCAQSSTMWATDSRSIASACMQPEFRTADSWRIAWRAMRRISLRPLRPSPQFIGRIGGGVPSVAHRPARHHQCTDDPMMPWIGGDIKVLWSRHGVVLSAQETFERWMKLGDCALPITHSPRNTIPHDNTSVLRHVARECKGGGEVRLYEILGGGHTWPGGNPYLGERLVGKVSRELNASDEIWSFVSRFSLP